MIMSVEEQGKRARARVAGAEDAPREITLHFDRLVEDLAAHPEPDSAKESRYDSAAALLAGLWSPYPRHDAISEEFEPGLSLPEQLLRVTDEVLDHAHELLYVSDPDNPHYRAHVDPAIYLTLVRRGWLSTSGEREMARRVRPAADATVQGEFF